MSSSPASSGTTGKCNLLHPAGHGRDEVKAERKVDEVHRLHQADDQEHDDLEPGLGFWLPSRTLDGGVAGQAVTDRGADRAATQCNSGGYERSRKDDRVIHDLPSCFYGCRGQAWMCAMPLFFETFARHTEIDDGEQGEDKCLDAADEKDVERLPQDQ